MKRILLSLTFFVLSSPLYATSTPRPLVTQPELEWARSYLLHQILITDYVSFAEAPAPSEAARAKRLESSEGVSLWKRARFALNAARAASQDLGETTAARALLLEHMAIVKRRDKKAFLSMKAFDEETDEKRQRGNAGAAIQDESTRSFLLSTDTDAPACTPSMPLKAKLWETVRQGGESHLSPVLEELRSANVEDVRCAVVTWLREGKKDERQAARIVVEAASHLPRFSADVTLSLLKATLLLGSHDYAEALRILFDQQNREASYRGPYDLVQVIFSRRQQGDGSVHINGM